VRSRRTTRAGFLATTLAGLMLMVPSAGASLSGPGCVPLNQPFGNMLANAVTSPGFKSDCTVDGQQGNFGPTGYANALFAFGGQNSATPCTKIGARVTYGINGVLFSSARIEQQTIGQWASAVAAPYRGIFSGTYYATQPGVYDVSTTVFVQGFNC
jgi:hypothetical protein